MKNYASKKEVAQEAYAYYEELTGETLVRRADGSFASQGHNDNLDAFRHAYVSGRFTQLYGKTAADLLGQANEVYGDIRRNQPIAERNMDLWNNAAGREAGVRTNSTDDLASEIFQDISNGKLITNSLDSRQYNPAPACSIREQNCINDNNSNSVASPNFSIDWWDGGLNAIGKVDLGDAGISGDMGIWSTPYGSWGIGASISFPLSILGSSQNHVSPIVLDLDGDGIETSHAYSQDVFFDIDNDGYAEKVGWLDADDGQLAFDANGNGFRQQNLTYTPTNDNYIAYKLTA